MTAYPSPERYASSVLVIAAIFAIVNVPSVSCWAGFGSVLREWLSVPVRLRWFNITMGALLALSLWPMLR
jgi:threonine/homoserine/homoserine lactone efflux protein